MTELKKVGLWKSFCITFRKVRILCILIIVMLVIFIVVLICFGHVDPLDSIYIVLLSFAGLGVAQQDPSTLCKIFVIASAILGFLGFGVLIATVIQSIKYSVSKSEH